MFSCNAYVGEFVNRARACAYAIILLLITPLIGSIQPPSVIPLHGGHEAQLISNGDSTVIPTQTPIPIFGDLPWWEYTTLDSNRNHIHDSLESATGIVYVGLSYDHTPTEEDENRLIELGFSVKLVVPAVDAILIGAVDALNINNLSEIEGVIMVERYGTVVFYGDVQTAAVKAINSTEYPQSAWQLGVSGEGVNVALTDTGVDGEHPGLIGKHVAGYDAVCFMHTDPTCAPTARETDGSFDPDDGNQHGTACMGMAAATGLEADGSQSDYYGSAPNATLIDVRIGTDVGAGPFENYLLEQDFYESAMNGIQWIIDNKDTAWPGVDESLFGIDIISLSWGITSHEGGGSDGEDMHSRILNEATLAGVTVSVAAGNDGPNNDGFSGMGSSSLSITVGATDDINTVDRTDDTVASYSSRGPRRDNGDGNPINELKPEISAPGTNIIQAEGCVTSGGCTNFLGIGDASENTYTGRGSGTSYATPAVTGVIALIMEINPDLDPLQIKEVLKQTAERRGDPSAPEVDPYWNRDFGYGMVDAYESVKLAQHLWENNQSVSIDPYLQNHLLLLNENTTTTISGHSWAQQGVIDTVEFRIDGGSWSEATYEVVPGELEAGTPFNWNITLDPNSLSKGNHTVEVRAVSGEMISLPVLVSVSGSGIALDNQGGGVILYAFGIIILVMVLAGVMAWRMDSAIFKLNAGSTVMSNDEILDAELVSSSDIDYSSMTNNELKELLIERGLPTSGNKQVLIDRLNEN